MRGKRTDLDVKAAFARSLSQVVEMNPELVCVDFGGTLLDFEPLHVNGFVSALGLEPGSEDALEVSDAIQVAARRGVDSFEMARSVAEAIRLGDVDLPNIVVKKREWVEGYLRKVRLDSSSVSFALEVMHIASVAVVSLGLIDSMKSVLARSLGSSAGRVEVFGRRTLSERVDKMELLTRAMETSGAQRGDVLYIGDAEVDQRIAESLGIGFLRLDPFNS